MKQVTSSGWDDVLAQIVEVVDGLPGIVALEQLAAFGQGVSGAEETRIRQLE